MQREREDERGPPQGEDRYAVLATSVRTQIDEAILLADATGRVVGADQQASALLGYSRERLLALRCDQLLMSRPAALAAARDQLRRDGRWQGLLTACRGDGRQSTLDVAISRLSGADRARLMLRLRPAPPGDGASAPLPLLEAALSQANDGVIITTAELDLPGPQIVYVNAAFSAMTGYSAEEMIGCTPRIFQGPASDRAELDRARAHLETGRPFHGELINYRKDGSSYMVEWRIAPIRDGSGKITHWVSIQQDVSARKAAEAERERLYQEAQSALRVRDELLMMVSHELKTPLTSLMGYTYLLQRMPADDPANRERTQTALRVIQQQTQRLNQLIDELLDLDWLQQDNLSLHRQPLDLAGLARRVVEEFQPLLERHTLTLRAPDEPQMISGDEPRMRHVLQELIQNALTYSPEGGAVRLAIEPEAEQVCIHISDPGIGVPSAAQSQIFQRFYRASNVNPTQISGFGVGLYIVREIVTRHRGSVTVNSREGQGSTFTICLPYLERARAIG